MYWKSDRCFRGAIDLHGMGIGVICVPTGKVEFQGEDIKQRVGARFERGRQKNRQTETNKPGIEATRSNTNKHFAFLLEICHGFGPMLRRANMGRREHDERFLGKRRDRESIIQRCYYFAR